MMKNIVGMLVILLTIGTYGCATKPQPPVELKLSESVQQNTRIAVAAAPLPKVNTHFPGAACLLCMALAEASNTSLTKHTQALPQEGLPVLKEKIATLLRDKGANVTVVDEPLDVAKLPKSSKKTEQTAKQDFSLLRKKYDVDKIVVLHVAQLGIQRDYQAYIPVGSPRAVLKGEGYMVNLNDNTYEWYEAIDVARHAEGSWDEPPSFPGLSNAYFQMLEAGQDAYLAPFRK